MQQSMWAPKSDEAAPSSSSGSKARATSGIGRFGSGNKKPTSTSRGPQSFNIVSRHRENPEGDRNYRRPDTAEEADSRDRIRREPALGKTTETHPVPYKEASTSTSALVAQPGDNMAKAKSGLSASRWAPNSPDAANLDVPAVPAPAPEEPYSAPVVSQPKTGLGASRWAPTSPEMAVARQQPKEPETLANMIPPPSQLPTDLEASTGISSVLGTAHPVSGPGMSSWGKTPMHIATGNGTSPVTETARAPIQVLSPTDKEAIAAKLRSTISQLEMERDQALAEVTRWKTLVGSLLQKLEHVFPVCQEADAALRG